MSASKELMSLSAMADSAAKEVYKTISAVFDELSFVETDKLVSSQTVIGEAIGEGAVCGFATLNDRRTAVFATNPAVIKGSIGKVNAAKIAKCIRTAISAGAGVVGIFDTMGARINEGIEALEGYGEIIAALSDAYGAVPTVCVVKGASLGLSAYLTAVCDMCVAYDKAQIATAAPLVLAAKSKTDAAKIGTAQVHAQQSGIVSRIVKNDKELKAALGAFFSAVDEPETDSKDDPNRIATLKGGEKATAVIEAAFDKGSFFETRAAFATEVITGFARLGGTSVGVAGINGRLTPKGAVKITELLNTCESFGLPIVTVTDCEGSVVSADAENCCLIREIANLLFTVSQMTVAKVSLITGQAIGLGYTAFASKSMYDYTLAWECAHINSMTDDAAANLIYAEDIAKAKDGKKAQAQMASEYGALNSAAAVVAKKGYLDNVIVPAHTRQYLIAAVNAFADKR